MEFYSPIARTQSGSRRPEEGAFTLVEMLVSMSVLIMLVIFLAQAVNMATQSTSVGRERTELDARCRVVLNVMGNDFSRMLKRTDLDYVFSKIRIETGGSDEFFFFSEVPGNAPAQTGTLLQGVSLVGYRVGSNGGLLRIGKALGWDKAPAQLDSVVYLPNTIPSQWPITSASNSAHASSDPDLNLIEADIFRLEFCLVDKTGGYFQPPANWVANGVKDVSAVVVTLAALNESSRKALGPDGVARLAAVLPDPKDADLAQSRMVSDLWQKLIEDGSLASLAACPAPLAQRVRVYERVYWLNH